MSSIPREVLGHSDAILSRAFLQNCHSSGFSCMEKSSVPQPLFVPPGRFSQHVSPHNPLSCFTYICSLAFLCFQGCFSWVESGERHLASWGAGWSARGCPESLQPQQRGGLWDASARMELSSPRHQCTLAFSASQVCGSGFVGDASHSCIFCGESAHFPPSFCSDCQENLGSGADPASPSCSHNTPMDFPSGGLAQANQTNFRSSSLLRLNRARK